MNIGGRPFVVTISLIPILAITALSLLFLVEWDQEPLPGGEYVEAVVGGPRYLNPLLARPDTVDADVVRLVFRGLTRVEGNEIVPDLAERWDVSDDGQRYRFFLDPNATWHDGRPVTAEDAVFTIRLLKSPAFPADRSVRDGWSDIAVERVEDGSVRFILPWPDPSFPERASLGLLPAHLLEAVPVADLPAHTFNRRPVGTGAYRVESASLNNVVLARHPGGLSPPYLARIRFQIHPDVDAARSAVSRGEANAMVARQGDPRQLRGDDSLAIHSAPNHGRFMTLLFNTQAPPFDDPALRRALAMAIDRRRLAESLGGAPASGPLPSSSWAYQSPVPSDADAADLLGRAGWQRVGERWQKDGRDLAIIVLTDDGADHLRVAQEVARQWSAIGVRADVQSAGWTGLFRDFLVPGTFQAAIVSQEWPNADPDVSAFWHSGGGLNLGRWHNETADDLLDQARVATDRDARQRLYHQFQDVFAAEMPAIPLLHPVVHLAVDRQVKDVHLAPIRALPDRFVTIGDWHVLTRRVTPRF
ncbi:MAG TPA: peptide ABC transporter substrate-binding protein [Chloroflexota bacterium]|nr:peptide ABC transporter substrate-binding protein [Chloroflexota bacterium]